MAVKAFRLDITPEQARTLADQLQRVADADLDHPSIVRLLGAGVEGSLAYTASEYVAAESFDIAVRHYAPAGLEMVLPFITQLAGAVDFARTAGIGHGALHPRDIFVMPEEARATGFGVVQALEALGVRAPVRRPYTAPERVNGGDWDVRADVYSVAAIAFELLTARRPVGSDVGTLGRNAGPHADALAHVLSRALSEDPSHRYPSGLAFAAALEASSRGERTTAAIEEVRTVTSGWGAASASGEAANAAVHDLTIEPEGADIDAERESDLADIQLREQETVAARPEPAADSVLGAPPDAASELPHEPPTPLILDARRGGPAELDAPHAAAEPPEPSLFELDREVEGDYDTPEVQHPGFQPGVLDPGYQSEPPPPEGWDEHPPIAEPPVAAPVQPPRRRSVVVPVAITLLLGLFVGFLAGYLVFVRDGNATAPPDRGSAASGPPEISGEGPATQQPPSAGQPAGERRQARPSSAPARVSPAPRTPPPSPAPAERARTTAPSPARGRLVVRSNPSGAQVFVNGRRRGTTPLAVRDLAPGTYTIRVAREGYADSSSRVSIRGTSVREVNLRLAPRTAPPRATFTGALYVDSRPRGARVLLDGKEVGVTPMQIGDVRAGTHVVRLELADHRTWTASARVVAGQVVRVTGSLERMR